MKYYILQLVSDGHPGHTHLSVDLVTMVVTCYNTGMTLVTATQQTRDHWDPGDIIWPLLTFLGNLPPKPIEID